MSKLPLDKRQIIKSSKKFGELFQKGKSVSSEHILLFAKESDKIKFGFAVSKKIKGAVNRNRAKRRLKEVLRINQKHLPQKQCILLVAKPGIEQSKFWLLSEEFLRLMKRLNE